MKKVTQKNSNLGFQMEIQEVGWAGYMWLYQDKALTVNIIDIKLFKKQIKSVNNMKYRTVQSLRDYITTQGEENANTKIICRISKLRVKKTNYMHSSFRSALGNLLNGFLEP